MNFNILDKVILTHQIDDAPIGTTGVIAGYDEDGCNWGCVEYTIYITSDNDFGHGADYITPEFEEKHPNYDRYNFYYVPEYAIQLTTVHKKIGYKKCCVCGGMVYKGAMYTNSKGKYVCGSCTRVRGYCTENNDKLYNPSSTHKTYGFEFECVPEKRDDFNGHVEMVSSKYGFIPTEDASLPIGGIEYKTPTINGLRGVRHMFNEVYNMVSFKSYKCGQHINIGDSKYIDEKAMRHIREYKEHLFNDLTDYMLDHSDDVKRVCGRDFCHYAEANTGYYHGCWLNLDNNNRLEFRISKFKNPKQYFELVNMWTEMLDTIINDFIIPYDESRTNSNCSNAKKASNHMIRIFKRYANGNAPIQKRDKAVA